MPTNNNVKRKSGGRGFELCVTLKGDAATLEALERLGATIVYGRPSWRWGPVRSRRLRPLEQRPISRASRSS